MDNNTIFGQGHGKIVSEDGQMIGWRSVDGSVFDSWHPGYRGIIYLILQWMKSFPPLIIPVGYLEAILVQINLYGYWNRLIKTSFKPQQYILI